MTDLRVATPADVDLVADLEAEVFGREAWSPGAVAAEFDGLGRTREILLAYDGATPVGYACLMHVAGVADVQRIAVVTAARRHGVASALLARLLHLAERHDCQRILLEVAADNRPALAFYRRWGFAEVSRRSRYYAHDIDAIVLARPTRREAQAARHNGCRG
jgi:ribosomal-protein-alanine N-acetyltransferase